MSRSTHLSPLESPDLRKALAEAEAGRGERFAFYLARASGLPGPRANYDLAYAVALELSARPRSAVKVLHALGAGDAAPDTAEVYLPIVSAFGFALLVERGLELAAAEEALTELAADERPRVRRAVTEALAQAAARANGPEPLVTRLERYVADERREVRWGAFGVVLDAVVDRRALERLKARRELLDVISLFATDLAEAPRAAERSDARRRGLDALTRAVPVLVAAFRGEVDSLAWFEAECERAKQPDVRKAFEAAVEILKRRGVREGRATIERFHQAIDKSRKPPRDPTLERKGTRRRAR